MHGIHDIKGYVNKIGFKAAPKFKPVNKIKIVNQQPENGINKTFSSSEMAVFQEWCIEAQTGHVFLVWRGECHLLPTS